MIFFVVLLALIVAVAFAIMTIKGNQLATLDSAYRQEDAKALKSGRWVVLGVGAVLMAVVLLFGSIRVIDSTEVGVVRSWGKINREIYGGFNLKNPLWEKVEKYDLRVHVRTAEFASYTKDAQPVSAAIEYQYKLRKGEVTDVAREYGSYEVLETKIAGMVEERVKSVFAEYGAMPLIERRATLSSEVFESLKSLEELYHIDFVAAVVSNIDFSDAFEASVEAKMTAEQDALRAEQEKKSAIVKAEQAKEVAAINADAAIEEARGEAEAMRITREAMRDMPSTYIERLWIEKWDGKLPMVSSDANSIVDMRGMSE